MSGNSRERSEEGPIWCKNPDGEALHNIINELLDERNLRDFHLKHYHISTSHFKKRTNYLDLPEKIYDIDQHVVKTCPFSNSTKTRPDRSHVSGLRTEECGDINFLDHGSAKMGDKNLSISDCLRWRDITFDSVSM